MATYQQNTSKGHYRLELVVNQSSQNVGANSSTVSWSLVLRKLDTYWANGWGDRALSYEAKLDGVVVASGTKDYDFRKYTALTLASGTRTIAHNTDGTKSFTVGASVTSYGGSHVGTGSVTGTHTLSTIPRATTLTAFTGFYTNATKFNITVSKKHASYVHDIYLRMGSTLLQSLTSQALPTGTHAIPLNSSVRGSLLARMPNSLKATVTLEIVTRSGSNVIGSSSRNATVTIEPTLSPSFGTRSVKATTKAGAISGVALTHAVQNVGTLTASFTANPSQGAKIVSTLIKTPDGNFTGTSKTWTPTKSGSYVVWLEIRDSRGFTTVAEYKLNIIPYTPLSASTRYIGRTRVKGASELLSELELLVNVNPLTIGGAATNDYRVVATATPTDKSAAAVTLVSQNYTNQGASNKVLSFKPSNQLDLYKSYVVSISVRDEYSSATIAGTISTASYPFVIGPNGIGVGKIPDKSHVLDVAGDIWDTVGSTPRNLSETVRQHDARGPYYLRPRDTRNEDTPTDLGAARIQYDFKLNATNGLWRGGHYNSVLTLQPWQDASGGVITQIGFGATGISVRHAPIGDTTWGPWKIATGLTDVSNKFTTNSAITDFKAFDDGRAVHISFTYKPTAGGVGGSIVNTTSYRPLAKVAVNVSPRYSAADTGKCSAFILENGALHPVTTLPLNGIQVYSATYAYAQ